MRVALVQLNSSDQPELNLSATLGYIRAAAAADAKFILTPEVTNCLSSSRKHQHDVLVHQSDDLTLLALRKEAAALGVWLLIGSLGLKNDDVPGQFANRSFLISPTGDVIAQYDKIHMFDAEISATEIYRESDGYPPGRVAVLARPPFGGVGMTICYDVRFAYLYRALAKAGAKILTVPAAFSPVSGKAHWEVLLRARAIETGCFVLAPAQTGSHAASVGKPRSTHGHSLAINPWGEVLADGGTEPGITVVDIDLKEVEKARRKIPSLFHDREFESPR